MTDDLWGGFHDSIIYDEGSCGPHVASSVVDAFGLSMANSATKGGSLEHLDIKRMDALQAIKLSLLQASFEDSTLYELSVNSNGSIEFIKIGGRSGGITDVYYEIQSSTATYSCSGVLVTGGKPLTVMRRLEYKPIWGMGGRKTFDVSAMYNRCASPNFSSHAVVVFRDPHLDSSYDDGIDNLYDITGAFDSIIGYAKKIIVEGTKDTNVNYSKDSAVIPLPLGGDGAQPNLGVLKPIKRGEGNSECWTGGDVVSGEGGAKIDIPEHFRFSDIRNVQVDNYAGVEQVVVFGWKIDYFNVTATPGSSPTVQLTDDNSSCVLNVNNTSLEIFRLEEGRHYVIGYTDGDPYVVFSKRSFPEDPKTYGAGTKIVYRTMTEAADSPFMPSSTACVLPTEGNTGILVDRLMVYVKFNTPSITVTDTMGNAKNIAEGVVYDVAPIINYEEPAPIAFNGSILDLSQGVVDKDPTTSQPFTDTPLEKALDVLGEGGHGMDINLSFLDGPSAVAKASSGLKAIMDKSSGISATYVCGPSADPSLGGDGNSGGIINNITYSYSDSASYTISVGEGDYLVDGLGGGCTLAPTLKASESVSARGVVIDSAGDGVYFKIRVGGVGDYIAINTSPTLVRVGDIVTCTIHNNPVEV